jgi:hypothetical protein
VPYGVENTKKNRKGELQMDWKKANRIAETLMRAEMQGEEDALIRYGKNNEERPLMEFIIKGCPKRFWDQYWVNDANAFVKNPSVFGEAEINWVERAYFSGYERGICKAIFREIQKIRIVNLQLHIPELNKPSGGDSAFWCWAVSCFSDLLTMREKNGRVVSELVIKLREMFECSYFGKIGLRPDVVHYMDLAEVLAKGDLP